MIILRKELKEIKKIKKWLLIFGRRKTGKTFLVENFLRYDDYFFIKRNRTIISKREDGSISYETFINIVRRDLSANKTIVVDEFHRLGEDFLEFLHHTKKKGKVILISSTLFLSKSLFATCSPILGLFAEVPIGLIDLDDVLAAIKREKIDKKSLVELAILFKEPIAIDYFEKSEKPRKLLAKIVMYSVKSIPALIGEIFVEEERSISAVYDGILRAIANGKTTSGEISSYLFSRKLVKKDDPSLIQQYLTNLVEFGLIRKIPMYNKNKFIYKHVSPLVRVFYYADEKYNISERKLELGELERIVEELMPKIVEDSIREFLAQRLGLVESIAEAKDFDIDACLLKFKKPEVVAEIKWKHRLSKKELEKVSKNLEKINSKQKLLFVPDKRKVKVVGVKVVDIFDFI